MVAGITQSRGPKSDKRDAYGLAEKLRVGNLDKYVFKAPRQFTRLRELSRVHMTLVGDVVRAQVRIKSLYRGRGVMVTGIDFYGPRRLDGGSASRLGSPITIDVLIGLGGRDLRKLRIQSVAISRSHSNSSTSARFGSGRATATPNYAPPIEGMRLTSLYRPQTTGHA